MTLTLITGASNGIGAAIARELAAQGHSLALTYRDDRQGAEHLASETGAQIFHADFADPGAAARLHAEVTQALGPVHTLVNNVGPGRATPLSPGIGAEAMQMMQVGLAPALDLSALCAPDMGAGSVILNISSLNGRLPPARVSAFAASKAALDAATLALAQELGPRGIRVCGIAPGPIERDDAPRPDDIRDKIRSRTALPRFGTPQDVAQLAAFLVSDRAGFLTGEVIGLHGGWQ
ncbi:SDR family NAD(P)-dependent oxidoreductase [Antarctobacter jejuensis]|uniref:SDR family NAD(P)-dependent oxidoreductase n=1 Tax=Antarctobacter jejuensis TaxID=1439938 RepID=UPI003FD5CD99